MPHPFTIGNTRANCGDSKMLVELFDFHSSPETGENWEETARWIKYEEDVEGMDKHWGRPHVSFLPFHSLMQFRKYFEKSLVLFDPHVTNLSDIISRLAVAMVEECNMDSTTAHKVANFLQVNRHRKQLTRGLTRASIGRQSSQSKHDNINNVSPSRSPAAPTRNMAHRQTSLGATCNAHHQSAILEAFSEEGEDTDVNGNDQQTAVDIDAHSSDGRATGRNSMRANERRTSNQTGGTTGQRSDRPLLRRLSTVIGLGSIDVGGEEDDEQTRKELLPDLTECTHVYTGVIDNMKESIICMIRFNEPKRFNELTITTTLPVRVLFILVGPPLRDVNYHELGRTVATLMSNQSFSQVALSAIGKQQLLDAVDDFLDLSIIIPPGNIDSRALLTVDDVRKALRERKRAKAAVEEEEKNERARESMKSMDALKIVQLDNKPKKFEVETELVGSRGRQDHVKDALKRTGRPFGGIIDDIKYRIPFYHRDFKDALTFQCITSAIFLFCANFASAVAFGEVMDYKTDGYMGVTEILLAHGVCGVLWGLLACQPLCIQAAVGPFLVLESGVFTLCQSNDLDFLAIRFWIGIWTMVFILLTTFVEGSFIVRYLTRFTEDIFTGLIAFIFVWEALKYLYEAFDSHPVGNLDNYCFDGQSNVTSNKSNSIFYNDTSLINSNHFLPNNSTVESSSPHLAQNQPNTALLSLLLVLLTFVLTYTLKQLRSKTYFGRTIRKMISDFAVPISVVLVITLNELLFNGTYIEHLRAPDQFSLTDPSKRGWFVNPMGTVHQPLPTWSIWACTVPALLVGILIFAQVEIVEILLAKPECGLKRPHGFHWDLIMCSALALLCSMFGLPWMCPAAVQTLSHACSLTVMKPTAPGAAPKIDHVIEQRVTCIVVGILHAVAAFAGVALQLIPVPVLFGLFMYLGVMGLLGLQFVHRLVLAFVPQKYFPEASYCKKVSMWRMHLFTCIQTLCFGLLWAVNLIKPVSLAFPFVLILIALFRMFIVPRIFHAYELDAIDGRGEGETKPAEFEEEDECESEDGVDKKAIL